jgi:O-acetyl-ADP-ribose deacetylase (regulator of RNase III)
LGGGGVDGMIHYVAGPELFKECKMLGGCETGDVKITKGYKLPAKFVIHTVGPVYGHENGREDELLESCYFKSLKLARESNLKTISFPCISTGVFHFPKKEAAEIAIKTVKEFIAKNPEAFTEIRFVTFLDEDYDIYKKN